MFVSHWWYLVSLEQIIVSIPIFQYTYLVYDKFSSHVIIIFNVFYSVGKFVFVLRIPVNKYIQVCASFSYIACVFCAYCVWAIRTKNGYENGQILSALASINSTNIISDNMYEISRKFRRVQIIKNDWKLLIYFQSFWGKQAHYIVRLNWACPSSYRTK